MQDLITIPSENVREVFISEEGLAPHLDKIRKEIDEYPVLDMSVKKQRAEIKTRVTAITKAKSYIENAGKALAADMKKEPKLVDKSRKHSKDTLTLWAEEVRKPLTEWEEAEKFRVDAIHRRINAIANMMDAEELEVGDSHAVKIAIGDLESIEIDDTFEEHAEYADATKAKTLARLYKWHANKVTHEKEQAELEELRKAKAEQDEKERLAFAKAELELEAKRAKEAEELRVMAAEDKVRRDEEAKLDAERQKAEQESTRLKLQAETAERQRLEAELAAKDAEAEAKQAAIDAEEAAERRVAEAKAAHDQKIIDDRLAEEAATKKREANKAHAKKINNQAVKCLMKIAGVDKELAIQIVTAIAKQGIDNVSIKY